MIEWPFLIFLGAVGVLILYYIILLIGWISKKRKVKISDDPPAVSVIVSAHNESINLPSLMDGLLDQDHPDFELIIIDDRSSDDSYEILADRAKLDSRLKVVRVDHVPDHIHSKKYALTLGIKAAKNDRVLHTDADCRPNSRSWIRAMASGFDENTNFVLGFSPYQHRSGFLNAFIRFETLWTAIQYLGMAGIGRPYMGVGRNLAYRKSTFLAANGFGKHQSALGGDDDVFVNHNAKGKVTRVALGKDAIIYSLPKTTWKTFMIQKKRHLFAGKRYQGSTRFWLGLVTLAHLLFWIMVPVLFIMGLEPIWIAGGLVLRLTALYIFFFIATRKTGIRFPVWSVAILDLIYVFYYISAGIPAMMAKRTRWS